MRAAQDVDVLTDRQPSGAWSALRWSLPTAITIIIVDQLTKEWALNTLAPGPCSEPDACIDLVAGVRFNLVFNTGAAFTRGSGYGPIIGVLAIIMTGVLIYLSTRRQDRFGIILFGALAGGAVGNLLDRIFRADDGPLSGAVIDFIDVGWWPVFNVADMAIVIGVVSIIAHAFLIGEPIVDPPGGGSDPDGEPAGEALDQPDTFEAGGESTGDEALDPTSEDASATDGAAREHTEVDGGTVPRDDLGDIEAVSGPSTDRPE